MAALEKRAEVEPDGKRTQEGSRELSHQHNHLWIGAEDLLAMASRDLAPPEGDGEAQRKRASARYQAALADARVRMGTLLRLDNVSLLLGAGCSLDAGGVSLATIPYEVERSLLDRGRRGQRTRSWLKLFYRCIRACAASMARAERHAVRRKHLGLLSTHTMDVAHRATALQAQRLGGKAAEEITMDDVLRCELPINLEAFLSHVHALDVARMDGLLSVRFESAPRQTVLDDGFARVSHEVRSAFAEALVLPRPGMEDALDTHRQLVTKLLTRPVNLRRVNLFTLNNDTLLEQAADAEGVVALDGFVGLVQRVFRPESFDQDLYFPAQTTEGRVHRLDRVLHLYKLHGSISWRREDPTWHNPYGVSAVSVPKPEAEPGPSADLPEGDVLIYPTPLKYGEALGLPYSELFRRFASAVVQPQSVLFIAGYGFGDEHVNAIIRQALAIPSFILVVVDPSPNSVFVTTLRAQQDRRIWVVEGPELGRLRGFVESLLPDLRDEEILRKVMLTHTALARATSDAQTQTQEEGNGGHAE